MADWQFGAAVTEKRIFALQFVSMGLLRLQLLRSFAPGLRIHDFQRQCVGLMSYFRLLDLRAGGSRVLRHVKPPRCGEAF